MFLTMQNLTAFALLQETLKGSRACIVIRSILGLIMQDFVGHGIFQNRGYFLGFRTFVLSCHQGNDSSCPCPIIANAICYCCCCFGLAMSPWTNRRSTIAPWGRRALPSDLA
ncbi:hypothetical protein ACH5RR_034303 [Cinchona calisaya]|uniref:Uncharacterized protein n=1 Tax=Cinchona calisaya TaxID=153742 RepID=A0ABD2YAH3_9GENT